MRLERCAIQADGLKTDVDQQLNAAVRNQPHRVQGIKQVVAGAVERRIDLAFGRDDRIAFAEYAGSKRLVLDLAQRDDLARDRGVDLDLARNGRRCGGFGSSRRLGRRFLRRLMRRGQDERQDKGQHKYNRKDDAGKHEVAAAIRGNELYDRGQARGCKGICLQVDDTGDQAADRARNAGRHHRLFQTQGNAVHGRLGNTSEQRGDTGRDRHLAHLGVLGLECSAEGRARLCGVAAQHGNSQQHVVARISQRQQAGRDERPVHTGHDDERHSACKQQHCQPRSKSIDRVDDNLQDVADHQAERCQQAECDRRGDNDNQKRL